MLTVDSELQIIREQLLANAKSDKNRKGLLTKCLDNVLKSIKLDIEPLKNYFIEQEAHYT